MVRKSLCDQEALRKYLIEANGERLEVSAQQPQTLTSKPRSGWCLDIPEVKLVRYPVGIRI
jgi:hypothetical protein